jgi:hypothetical protein
MKPFINKTTAKMPIATFAKRGHNTVIHSVPVLSGCVYRTGIFFRENVFSHNMFWEHNGFFRIRPVEFSHPFSQIFY